MGKIISTFFSWLLMGCYILLPIGWVYWLWLAIKIGGFGMFAFALFPFTTPFAALLGGWSLLFGLPNWAFDVFVY